MIFVFLMSCIRGWYDLVLLPTIMNPYSYLLVFAWIVIIGTLTYAFLYGIDRYRMQYLYRCLCLAILKSAGYGMLVATLCIGLYNVSLYFTITSDFFKYRTIDFYDISTHMPLGKTLSEILVFRILTILFLAWSMFFVMKQVLECSYQLQNDKNWYLYAGLVTFGSVVCYLICMMFGAV